MDDRGLGASYVYLLGLYLGDGTLTRAPKNVWKLRIFQDHNYVDLIRQCAEAMTEVCANRATAFQRQGCVELIATWKHWICVFPQHGPGKGTIGQYGSRNGSVDLCVSTHESCFVVSSIPTGAA